MSQDKTELFIELLDKYLDGETDPNIKKQIDVAIAEDSFLADVMRQHIQARANMRVAGEVELKNKFLNKFEPISKEPKNRNVLQYVIFILGALALAFLAYTFFKTAEDPEIEPRHIASTLEASDLKLENIEDPSFSVFRSESDPEIAASWKESIQFFLQKDYVKTLERLEELEANEIFIVQHGAKYNLMRGVSFLKLSQFENAIAAFDKVDQSNPYFDQVEWYKALSYYYVGDSVNAKSMFQSILQKDAHYKKEVAQNFLDLLRD